MAPFLDVDDFTRRLRPKIIRPAERSILISRLADSAQASDAAEINCGGYGRIRTLATEARKGWGDSCVRHRVAFQQLRVPPEQAEACLVFQNAACNFRCWFCFVDYALLAGDAKRAKWFTPSELVDAFEALVDRPNILVLSGGQPDLTPEWGPWMLLELDRRNLGHSVFVWMDDNLSGFTSWDVLTDADWDLLRRPTFARLCGIKGIDAERFAENTSARPEYFERQFDILARLIGERVELYIELCLTSARADDVERSMRTFVDRLASIHELLPLRVNPTEIREYSPTKDRLNDAREIALRNQYAFNDAWQSELHRRYSGAYLAKAQPDIRLW